MKMKSHLNCSHYIPKLFLTFVLVAATAVRFWGLGFGLPHRYHIDEPPWVLGVLKFPKVFFLIFKTF